MRTQWCVLVLNYCGGDGGDDGDCVQEMTPQTGRRKKKKGGKKLGEVY